MTSPTKTPFLFRVCYSDTDAAGFVYHARYLEIFERSRAEWLYQRGLSPSQLVGEFGIVLPVREITMNFHRPGRLDDLLSIDQVIEHRGRTQIAVKQTATRVNPNTEPELLASALLRRGSFFQRWSTAENLNRHRWLATREFLYAASSTLPAVPSLCWSVRPIFGAQLCVGSKPKNPSTQPYSLGNGGPTSRPRAKYQLSSPIQWKLQAWWVFY